MGGLDLREVRHGGGLRKAGAVIDLGYTLFPSPLSEADPRGGSVRHYVPTDRLLWVSLEHCPSIHLRHHLVGDHHCHPKLVCQPEESAKELCEVHLPRG